MSATQEIQHKYHAELMLDKLELNGVTDRTIGEVDDAIEAALSEWRTMRYKPNATLRLTEGPFWSEIEAMALKRLGVDEDIYWGKEIGQ